MFGRRPILTVSSALFIALAASAPRGADKDEVPYPEGYRSWTHVKSMVLEEGHPLYESFGGIHHIYANRKALSALQAGSAYADGSVMVFDLLEAKSDAGALQEGPRKVLGVMHKDARRHEATGGWGFEAFRGDTRERVVGTNAASACFTCHAAQEKTHFVFTAWRP